MAARKRATSKKETAKTMPETGAVTPPAKKAVRAPKAAVAAGAAPVTGGKAKATKRAPKAAAKAPKAAKAAPGARPARKSATKGEGAPAKSAAGKSLVIVESPTKSRTLTKFLGRGYVVMASNGHIMDLPKSKLGVDIDNDFEPVYVPIRTKNQALAKIQAAAKDAVSIFLAPDPDREGEAIAWHLAEALKQ